MLSDLIERGWFKSFYDIEPATDKQIEALIDGFTIRLISSSPKGFILVYLRENYDPKNLQYDDVVFVE